MTFRLWLVATLLQAILPSLVLCRPLHTALRRLPVFFASSLHDSGPAPTVTLLGGWMRPREDFRYLARHLQLQGYQVVLPETRGSGASVTTSEFSMVELAHDVLDLWKERDIQESALVGFSMGGMIAQEILLQNEEIRIPKAILVSTTCREQETNREVSVNDTDLMRRAVAPSFAEKHRSLLQRLQRDLDHSLKDPAVYQAAIWQRKAIQLWCLSARPPRNFSTKIRVLHGEKDSLFPVESAKELAYVWNTDVEILTDSGHLLLLEKPYEMTRRVLEILEDKPVSI